MTTEQRIEALQAENERLREALEEEQALRERLMRAVEALEFYGTGDYSCDADWFPADGVIEDCGAKARNILADGAA